MSDSELTKPEFSSDIFWEKLQKHFFKNIFQETKLKLCILQSAQRRKNINYSSRTNVYKNNNKNCLENGVGKITKLKKFKFDENENLPSLKILNEIKLDRILEGLIKIWEVALKVVDEQQVESTQGQWYALCSVIEEQHAEEMKLENLEKELKAKRLEFKQIRSHMENKRIQTEQRSIKQNENIASLRNNLQIMHRLNQIELKLVQKWEENRYTQAIIVTANAELSLKSQIKQYQHLKQAEECRLRESEKYMALQMAGYKNSIAEWQLKFTGKLNACEKTNQEQVERIFDLRKQHNSKREIYKERVQYINEYLSEKAAEQELLMQEMLRIESAVHIQAWWRGIMVRRGLGQFRKKTKKSKKTKK